MPRSGYRAILESRKNSLIRQIGSFNEVYRKTWKIGMKAMLLKPWSNWLQNMVSNMKITPSPLMMGIFWGYIGYRGLKARQAGRTGRLFYSCMACGPTWCAGCGMMRNFRRHLTLSGRGMMYGWEITEGLVGARNMWVWTRNQKSTGTFLGKNLELMIFRPL